MRVAPKIMLTSEEEKVLIRLSGSNTASVPPARRARIVLLAAAGLDNKAIAAELNVGRIQVGRWRERYAEGGLAVIERDLPRSGRKPVDRETPKGKTLHLVCDNYATHKHPKLKEWLEKPPRFHVHFTPTSASWLNLVERFFRDITTERLRRGVFTSVPELTAAVHDYVAHHNENPKAFIWTAKANDILQKVVRANSLSSNQNEALH